MDRVLEKIDKMTQILADTNVLIAEAAGNIAKVTGMLAEDAKKQYANVVPPEPPEAE